MLTISTQSILFLSTLMLATQVRGFLHHKVLSVPQIQHRYTDHKNMHPLASSSTDRCKSACLSDKYKDETEANECITLGQSSSRRSFLSNSVIASSAFAVASLNPQTSLAAEEDGKFSLYTDASCGFQMKVPSGWEKSEQSLPDRRKIVLYIDPNGSSTDGKDEKNLIFIAYTPIRDDFTSLSSFGSVDQVGQMTILPKGNLAGQETKNMMLASESKKNSYYFDYTSGSSDQPLRHFRTIFSLASGATGGAGGVLVTITAQTIESRYESFKGMFDEIIDSYGKLK